MNTEIVKISSTIYSKLIHKAANTHRSQSVVYLLGMNENDIVVRMVPLLGRSGCWRMPGLSPENLTKNVIFLSLKGYKVCGLARILDNFGDNVSWNKYSGDALYQIEHSFILTVDQTHIVGLRYAENGDYRQLVIGITDK